jgi:hypothetical protein
MTIVPKRSSTTKDVALLQQLHKEGQLKLAPEFQRNSVWPTAAKAYLIDTILSDRPIPILFFQRTTSPQTGRPVYDVIDGQQRLRAVFEFLDNRLRLSETKNQAIKNKRFSDLPTELQGKVLNYDLVIEELSGYSPADIEDMFVRMNRYVVKLSRQELRHAKEKGAFKAFVETIGNIGFWRTERVFSDLQIRRMRAVEFSAELVILLIEGPQDKKKAVDLYYGKYRESFPPAKQIESRLAKYLRWIKRALPDLATQRYRKPVDLYSLIAALEFVTGGGKTLSKLNPVEIGPRLIRFEQETQNKQLTETAAQYVISASRQTDNLDPRLIRMEILATLLVG